ncbi:tRNA pseudouridine synthase A [Glycine soja]
MTENLKHTVDLECSDNNINWPSKISIIEYPIDSDIDEEEEMIQNPRNGIQRYLVAIEYIGTRFSGSQKQLNVRTVVGVLEEAFSKFVGQPVSVSCSSRTDAGVHALSNVCHVDIQRISKRRPGEVLTPHEPAVVGRAVNHFLQKQDSDLMVIDVRCVPSDFHARFKAQERIYFYRLLSGPEPLSTFEKDRAWHVPEELSLPAMQHAEFLLDSMILVPSGQLVVRQSHQLELWMNSVSMSIDKVMASSQDVGFGKRRRHRCLVVTARARAFLYHQVRLLVGVLKAVGTGNLTIPDVERILNARTVTAASPMAPACGLYLGEVKYDLPTT